eukprot:INCI6123.1.p2 GENE.INCI6123.1~~INCI6123.1.p2  ORF type:complete len:163 (-),score=22.05 INCI6123.1:889-1377(-)
MSTEEATGVGGGAGLTEDTPAAPQEAVGVKEVEPSIKVFRFVGDVAHANVRFNCQITFLKGSFMVWVGPATSPATLANLTLSVPTRFSKVPSTASVIQDPSSSDANDRCDQFSQKLSQALAAPVFATYTLGELPGVADAVTVQVLKKIREVSDKIDAASKSL